MSESWPEQKIRLQSMAYGDTTWDLSDNDTDAITEALRRIDAVEAPAPPQPTDSDVCMCGDYRSEHRGDGICRACGTSRAPWDGCQAFTLSRKANESEQKHWDEFHGPNTGYDGEDHTTPQAAQPICPVCYQPLESLPENHTICPNCKTQFGYDDVGHSYEELRNMWQAAQPVASPTPEEKWEELWAKYRSHQDGNSFPAVMHHNFLAAIREALAAQSEAREAAEARLAAQKNIIATLGEGKAAAEQRAEKAEAELRQYKRATEEG